MFIEFPKTSNNKIGLYINSTLFKFRIYYKGYNVFVFTLWDKFNCPLIWWCPNYRRYMWGSAFLVSKSKN